MTWKKHLAALGTFALLGSVGTIQPPVQAVGNISADPTVVSDMPHHVVEGGDFKVATLKGDRLLETYRLAKYDVLDIQIVGFSTFASSIQRRVVD